MQFLVCFRQCFFVSFNVSYSASCLCHKVYLFILAVLGNVSCLFCTVYLVCFIKCILSLMQYILSTLCNVSCLFYTVYHVCFMQCILSVSCLFYAVYLVCFMQCILSVSCLFYAVYLVCFMQCCFTTPRSGDASHFSICCCWFDLLKANSCGGCVPSCCRDWRGCFPAPGWRLACSRVRQHQWRSCQQM